MQARELGFGNLDEALAIGCIDPFSCPDGDARSCLLASDALTNEERNDLAKLGAIRSRNGSGSPSNCRTAA
jgi:hypothetical protein